MPFQWSLHSVDSKGDENHREFLADSHLDPRRRFAETLIAALKGTRWPIIVYSSYEQTRLAELARDFPNLARPAPASSSVYRTFCRSCGTVSTIRTSSSATRSKAWRRLSDRSGSENGVRREDRLLYPGRFPDPFTDQMGSPSHLHLVNEAAE
jgi:hypothetical protein